ncbi:MAG: hypothetical protein ABFC62_08150 [Clostridiaceae bacterium]|nr:hypothetical protein [Eubacteriales bacterium]
MADRMDDILRAVADEANESVAYAALHDAILAARKKTQKSAVRPIQMLSYAAVFVVGLGLGALALSRGMFGMSFGAGSSAPGENAAKAQYDSYTVAGEDESTRALEEAPAPMPMLGASAPGGGDTADGTSGEGVTGGGANGAVGETEAPILGAQIMGDEPADTITSDALAAEVLTRGGAAKENLGVLSAAERGMAGESPFGGYACNTSYSGVYIEPNEGAPELGRAVISDYGNGELHIYWSASEKLHVYAYFIGYTQEEAVALLAKMR